MINKILNEIENKLESIITINTLVKNEELYIVRDKHSLYLSFYKKNIFGEKFAIVLLRAEVYFNKGSYIVRLAFKDIDSGLIDLKRFFDLNFALKEIEYFYHSGWRVDINAHIRRIFR